MSKLAAFLRRGAPAALAALLLLGAVPAAAEEAGAKVYAPELSFRSYTYSRWGDPIACPDPYTVEKVVTGVDLGVGDFKKPNDMFASADGYLYIAASGDTAADNRVVKLDKNLQVVGSFSGYIDADGQTVAFKEPLGVFITAENDIYVADGTSKQIIHMDAAGKLKRIIAAPSSEDSAIIDADFVERYRPSKLVVDSSGRIHVVAINVNEGIVEFDPDGKFEGFLAAGKVNANPIEVIWKKLSTQAQLERMSDFVPIEYNNVSLDDEDFIFATSAAIDGKVVVSELRSGKGTEQGALVRRLNMLGKDILRRKGFGPPSGDREFVGDTDNIDSPYIGTSKFVDVANGPDGTYTVLDSTRSRLFTYDSEGYLLYAFGGPDVTAGWTTACMCWTATPGPSPCSGAPASATRWPRPSPGRKAATIKSPPSCGARRSSRMPTTTWRIRDWARPPTGTVTIKKPCGCSSWATTPTGIRGLTRNTARLWWPSGLRPPPWRWRCWRSAS